MPLYPGEGNPVCKFHDPFFESIMQALAEASSFVSQSIEDNQFELLLKHMVGDGGVLM